MTIRTREENNITIVDIDGQIDINSSEIIETIGWLIKSHKTDILLNFDKVGMVDYSGISILAIAYKNVMNNSGKLKFCNVALHIEELFKVVRLDSIFEVYRDEEAALKTFHSEYPIDRKPLRRRFKRLDVHITAEFRPKAKPKAAEPAWHKDQILNMGGEGLFLYTKKLMPLGAKIELRINLLDRRPIEIEGAVIWLADKGLQPQSYPGMGIQFKKLRKEEQDRVLAFINRHLTYRSTT